jgi:tRNA-splicing ligase RtcB
MFELKKLQDCIFTIPKTEDMLVDGLIVASEDMLEDESMKEALQQVKNVATLPGIVRASIAMPDIHWGYGFPIGGVAAMDAKTGVISPGGVGYDINCGVRLAMAPMPFTSLSSKQKEELLLDIYKRLPSGIGKGHDELTGLTDQDYKRIAERGVNFSIEQGLGFKEDIENCESQGFLKGADSHYVSSFAKQRGSHQLGSIGSGNHFVEIGAVDKLFDEKIASNWGVFPGQTYILIHSGSRGFGHQICQDTLDLFVQQGLGKGLKDKQLIYAPIQSDLGKNYFKAMATAANYAFNNRQHILILRSSKFSKNT